MYQQARSIFLCIALFTVNVFSITDLQAQQPIPAKKLIVPGKQIGLTRISDRATLVRKRLGAPSFEEAAMGKSLAQWISANDNRIETDIFFITNMGAANEASRAEMIRVSSPYFITQQQIATGSTLSAIQPLYPRIKKLGTYTQAETHFTIALYDDRKAGICFEIDEAGKCVGIAIHKPGKESYGLYFALFPGFTIL
ncbi:MAG: hypothetical protein WCH29_11935 [Chitinophagaceae bacterium]